MYRWYKCRVISDLLGWITSLHALLVFIPKSVRLVHYVTAVIHQYEWMNTFQLQVDAVSHLVLQVYLGPNGEERLYHISMTFATGSHESSPAILRNKIRENTVITVVNIKQTIEKCMNIPQTHLCLAEEGKLETDNRHDTAPFYWLLF